MFILCPNVMNKLIIQIFCWFIGVLDFLGLLSGCSSRKDISKEPPYNQCVGKKFALKEDVYIFKFYDNPQYLIAGPNSGVNGLATDVNKQYIGTSTSQLSVIDVKKKGTSFTLVKVIDESSLDNSYINFFIKFDDLNLSNDCINATRILNWKFYPFTKTWGDPPIFKSDLVEPLPSDGIWWK